MRKKILQDALENTIHFKFIQHRVQVSTQFFLNVTNKIHKCNFFGSARSDDLSILNPKL